VLVTGAVECAVRDRFLFRTVDMVVPSGTSRPIEVFELLATAEGVARDLALTRFRWLSDWDAAVAAFRSRNWERAQALFEILKTLRPQDSVASMYFERCKEFLVKPPPSEWDGAKHYDEK
jgi:adenylate cyclase